MSTASAPESEAREEEIFRACGQKNKQDKNNKKGQKEMPMNNNAGYSKREYQMAQNVHLFPCMAQMSNHELQAMGFNPEAVSAVMSEVKEAKMHMHGISSDQTLTGWQVVASEGIKTFYEQLAALDGFSTTYSQAYVLPGNPNVKPRLEVPVYSAQDAAEMDNYENFNNRGGGKCSSVDVELHKFDVVLKFYARNFEQGLNPKPIIEGGIASVAEAVLRYVLTGVKTGETDKNGVAVKAHALPVPGAGAGQFNFGYAQQTLTELVQPRTNALLLNKTYYGALKAVDRQSFTPEDVDADLTAKVAGLDKVDAKCAGIVANKRCMAVGLAAPYFLQGAYASVEQLQHNGLKAPITLTTYYDAGENCMKVIVSAMAGRTLVDASAVYMLEAAE